MIMSKTHDLLVARREEVKAQMAPLKAELEEINAALAAIDDRSGMVRVRYRTRRSIGDLAIEVLRNYPDGARTRRIVREVSERFNRVVKNQNMSWHLSHLKSGGRVVLDGGLWRLPTTKHEASDVASSDASEDGGGGAPSSIESQDVQDDIFG